MTLEEKKQQVKFQFLKDTATRNIDLAFGIYGEKAGCDAYIEKEVKDDTGSVYLKPYGQFYLFKGRVRGETVHGLELSKALTSSFPRLITEYPILTIAFGLFFTFQKKGFIHFIDFIFEEINHKVVNHLQYPEEEYTPPVKEIKRSLTKALEKVFGFDLKKPYYPVDHPRFKRDRVIPDPADIKYKSSQLGYALARFIIWLCLFLDSDTAYRFRVQDALGKKEADVFKVLNLLIERETGRGISHKWKFIKLLLRFILWRLPELKQFINEFLLELDNKKVAMDESDIYYSCMYLSYNFGGLPQKERWALRRKMDEDKRNVFLIGWPEYE